MASWLAAGVRGAADAWAQVRRSDQLRRAQLSFAAMWAGEAAVLVAVGVVAYRDGGASAVGIVTALRMAPAALVAPLAATVADRVRRERVLAWVGVVRAITLGCAAGILALDGPTLAVYGVIVIATIAQTLYRPAHSALLPALCRSPEELASANVVRGLLDSAGTLGGPLVAGILLAASGPAAVFAACAAASLWAGATVARLSYDVPPRAEGPDQGPKALVRGLALLASEPGLRLVTSLGLAQTLTRGALNVLLVVMAIDLLDAGDAGVGWLSAAIGAGGVLGGLSAFSAVGGGRLGAGLGLGVALFGAPLIILGLVPEMAAAVVLLGVIGLGNALIDACGFTLLARLTDEAVLARMFAGFEALLTLGIAVGGLMAPLAVDALGLRDALVAVGLLAPLAVAAGWRALRRLDAVMAVRDADIGVLRELPLLRALPAATIEQLGSRLEREEFAPGEIVFEQGAVGEHFYAVESGSAEVLYDGRHVGLLGRGEYFGEIALLRDKPRTATVRAAPGPPLRVGALPRYAFLTAVTGYPASAAAGERLAAQRIDALGYGEAPPAIVTSAETDTR